MEVIPDAPELLAAARERYLAHTPTATPEPDLLNAVLVLTERDGDTYRGQCFHHGKRITDVIVTVQKVAYRERQKPPSAEGGLWRGVYWVGNGLVFHSMPHCGGITGYRHVRFSHYPPIGKRPCRRCCA